MKKIISVILAVLVLATAVTVGFTVFAAGGEEETTNATENTESTEATQPTEQTVYTPADVKGLKASDVKTTSLSLSWKQSTYATKYVVYRASESDNGTIGDYKKIATVNGISNTKYKDASLKAGKIYKYKVYAYREKDGQTTHSKQPGSVVVMTIPSAVSSFTVSDKTTTTATFKWTKNTSATSYVLYRCTRKSDGSYTNYTLQKTITKASTVSFKATKLSSGALYKYKIIVRRTKLGITKNSAEKVVKFLTILDTPKNLRNTKATTSSISLAWNKTPRATKYELWRKVTGSGSFKKIKTLTGTTYKDTSVSSGTNYTYRVRAIRTVEGKTYYSKYTTLSTCTGVVSVKGVKTKSYLGRALITWNSMSNANGYDVFMLQSGSYKRKASTVYPRFLSGKLTSGRVYSFSIKAYKNVGGQKVYGTTKYVKVKIKGTAYGKKPSGTWVEVCTETQTLYMYVKNKLYLTTPVVTGNPGGLETTPGYHHVMSKSANTMLTGSSGGYSWNTFVNFWLGFTWDGQGIHDAPWRSAYGGEIYKGNGSHGCVNTPYNNMKKVYSKAYVGMPVIVY